MPNSLSFDLHALTSRLDRAADRILQTEQGISYARFMALFMVGELNSHTQRALAEGLGVTEPSVSRMTSTLASQGLLTVSNDPSGGNRKHLQLTAEAKALVKRCSHLLEARFQTLVVDSDVSVEEFASQTRRILQTLERSEL